MFSKKFNPHYKTCWTYVGLMVVCVLVFYVATATGLTEGPGKLAMDGAMLAMAYCLICLCVEEFLWSRSEFARDYRQHFVRRKQQSQQQVRVWTEDDM